MVTYDFYIPEEYRGREIALPVWRPDWPREPVDLLIPSEAHHLDVNPLEDEEEFLGNQGDSDRQQLLYYNEARKIVTVQDLEHQIITFRLMCRLELLLKIQY